MLRPVPPRELSDEDAVLVVRVSEGDVAAYRELVRRHAAKLTHYARRLLGDESEAEGHRDAGQRMLGVPRLGLSLGSAAAIAINADLVEDDVRDAIRAGAAAVSTSKPRREPTHQ